MDNGNKNEQLCCRCYYYRKNIMDTYDCKRYPSAKPKRSNDWCGEFDATSQGVSQAIIQSPISTKSKKRGRPRITIEEKGGDGQ
jgi:hypothetical protein